VITSAQDRSTLQTLNRALHSANRGDYAAALESLEGIRASHSRDSNVLGLYAYVNLKLGHYPQAEASLKKALRRQPRNPQTLNIYCQLHLRLGELEDAAEKAELCLRIDPKQLDARLNLGVARYRMGEYADAEQVLRRLIATRPGHVSALIYLGLACQKQMRFREALEHYEAALAVDPRSVEALHNQGIVLKDLFRADEAIESLTAADAHRPNDPTICHNLASAYVIAEEPDKALHYFRKAIDLEPMNPEHHHWLNLFLWRESSDEFLRSYYDLLARNPDANAMRRELVAKLKVAKQYTAALEQLDHLARHDADDPLNLLLRGNILREQRRFGEALDAHRQAHETDASNLDFTEALATSQLAAGEAKAALPLIVKLTQSNPDHQGYWALKAIALRMLGSDEYHYLYNYERLVLAEHIGVPAGFSSLREFNRELLAGLQKYHHAKAQPLDQSLLHGTQSIGDLFQESSGIVTVLRDAFDRKTTEFLAGLPEDAEHPLLRRRTRSFKYAGAWSVMLESSGFHVNHIHTMGWYSGPYYVHLPSEVSDDSNRDGWIKLGEPGFPMLEPLEADCIIRPEEGLMIRFPSYFWHGTFPFQSTERRVIVACDILPRKYPENGRN
jgi:tetratricopeptide (TPR) repeat protein